MCVCVFSNKSRQSDCSFPLFINLNFKNLPTNTNIGWAKKGKPNLISFSLAQQTPLHHIKSYIILGWTLGAPLSTGYEYIIKVNCLLTFDLNLLILNIPNTWPCKGLPQCVLSCPVHWYASWGLDLKSQLQIPPLFQIIMEIKFKTTDRWC